VTCRAHSFFLWSPRALPLARAWLCLFIILSSAANVAAISGDDGSIVILPGNVGGEIPEGNVNNTFPFIWSDPPSQRYQQVYGASIFAEATGPFLITKLAFRRDALSDATAMALTITNLQIEFSTTSAGPGTLSSIFALNIGADHQVVYSGAFSISSSSPLVGLTRPFDITINLSTPFEYDPAAGNLLMDVRRWSPTPDTAIVHSLDAQSSLADSTSRVYTDLSLGVDSPTGFTDSIGLVTKFTATAVPEPSPLILLVLGAVLLLIRGATQSVDTSSASLFP